MTLVILSHSTVGKTARHARALKMLACDCRAEETATRHQEPAEADSAIWSTKIDAREQKIDALNTDLVKTSQVVHQLRMEYEEAESSHSRQVSILSSSFSFLPGKFRILTWREGSRSTSRAACNSIWRHVPDGQMRELREKLRAAEEDKAIHVKKLRMEAEDQERLQLQKMEELTRHFDSEREEHQIKTAELRRELEKYVSFYSP